MHYQVGTPTVQSTNTDKNDRDVWAMYNTGMMFFRGGGGGGGRRKSRELRPGKKWDVMVNIVIM